MKKPARDMSHHPIDHLQVPCPTCKGKGTYLGPIPYEHCMRCAGFGTVVIFGEEEEEAA